MRVRGWIARRFGRERPDSGLADADLGLSALLDEGVSTSERERLEAALARDDELASALSGMRIVRDALSQLGEVPAPRSFVIASEATRRSALPRLELLMRLGAAITAMLVVFAFSADLSGGDSRESTQSDDPSRQLAVTQEASPTVRQAARAESGAAESAGEAESSGGRTSDGLSGDEASGQSGHRITGAAITAAATAAAATTSAATASAELPSAELPSAEAASAETASDASAGDERPAMRRGGFDAASPSSAPGPAGTSRAGEALVIQAAAPLGGGVPGAGREPEGRSQRWDRSVAAAALLIVVASLALLLRWRRLRRARRAGAGYSTGTQADDQGRTVMTGRSISVLIAGSALGLLLGLVVGVTVLSGGDADDHATEPGFGGITVVGTGSVEVPPDVASVGLGVEATAATVAEARSLVADAMVRVLASTAANGIAPADIRTSSFEIYPQYDYQSDEGPEIVGYVGKNSVEVTVRDIDASSEVLDDAIAAGGDLIRIRGISFRVEDPAPYLEEARLSAIADARRQAETIAMAAGVDLGDVRWVVVGGGQDGPVTRASFAVLAEAADAGTSISPGENELTSRITVTFDID